MGEKVALLFWGLTRGLKYTLKSLNNMVIDPIKKEYDIDIFIHTYIIPGQTTYSNPRHNVENCILDFEEYKLLNAKYVIIDNQEKIEKKIGLEQYRGQPDLFGNDYKSNDNHIISLYSQQEITKLFNKYKHNYKYVVYLRPDVTFLDKFNLKWFEELDKRDNTIIIPGWDCYDKWVKSNLNNRFAICKSNDAYKYGDILRKLHGYSLKKSIMAEEYLGYILRDYYKMNIVKINFLFQRTLPDGKIMWRDENIESRRISKDIVKRDNEFFK